MRLDMDGSVVCLRNGARAPLPLRIQQLFEVDLEKELVEQALKQTTEFNGSVVASAIDVQPTLP